MKKLLQAMFPSASSPVSPPAQPPPDAAVRGDDAWMRLERIETPGHASDRLAIIATDARTGAENVVAVLD